MASPTTSLAIDADPLREFDKSFRARFGDWPEVYLKRWYEDFLAE